MKRCPECRRDYYDDTLLYCLDDGNALLEGPGMSEPPASASGRLDDEPATAILHSTAAPGEAPTRAQINTTNETAILPSDSMPQQRSSAEYLVSQVKEHKKGFLLGVVLLLLVIAGAVFGIYKFAGGKQAGSTPSFESMKITKLTDTGRSGSAAISPDGKYVAHIKRDAGEQSLWVVHIATGSNVQIIQPAPVSYGGVTFTPDGNYIYFEKWQTSEGSRPLYVVPVLGGEPKKLNANVTSAVTFSPDGRRIAFVRNGEEGAGTISTMMIANADGTGEQPLAKLEYPAAFKGNGPAWSPDGKVIASAVIDKGQNIVAVGVDDGTIKPVGTQKWPGTGRVAWLSDGSGLITSSVEVGSGAAQIYQISYPGGEARKITNDLNDYGDVSLTADSSSMVVAQNTTAQNIWVAPNGDAAKLRQLTEGALKREGEYGVQWTPDGRIVYSSESGGSFRIWLMNADGGNPRRLNEIDSWFPTVSPDGRYIVYAAVHDAAPFVERMDIDGGNVKQLTGVFSATSVSPDGRWIAYNGTVDGVDRVSKIPIDGGEPVHIAKGSLNFSTVSPDGRSIAYLTHEQPTSPWSIAIIPFEGGEPKLLNVPAGFDTTGVSYPYGTGPQAPHWMPDGRSLAYIVTRDGVSNIWSMPIAGGAPKQLTNFTSNVIWWFDISSDGKPSLFSRGTRGRDVVLISGFRK